MSIFCQMCMCPLYAHEADLCTDCERERAYYDAMSPEEFEREQQHTTVYIEEQDR